MTGSGTCRDVCKELGIYCWSSDLHQGFDACDRSQFHGVLRLLLAAPTLLAAEALHRRRAGPVRTPTLEAFLERYELLLKNSAQAVLPGGKLAS